MKKIFTILVALTVGTTLFAQQGEGRKHDDRDNNTVYNDGRFNKDDDHYGKNNDHYGRSDDSYDKSDNRGYGKGDNRYNAGRREMEVRAGEINRNYDQRIQIIRGNWFMSRNKKERMIMVLENQRRGELQRLNAGSHGRDDRGDGRDRNGHW